MPLAGGGLVTFLVFAGLPPGVVFLAKLFIVGEVLATVGGGPAFLLALREFISWGVYLSILAESVLLGGVGRAQLWEWAVGLAPVLGLVSIALYAISIVIYGLPAGPTVPFYV